MLLINYLFSKYDDERIILRHSIMLPNPNSTTVYMHDKKTILCLSGNTAFYCIGFEMVNVPIHVLHRTFIVCDTVA